MAGTTASQCSAVPAGRCVSGYDTASRGLAWMREQMARERVESGLLFNPFANSFQRDPEAVYAQLRHRSPVHFSRLLDCWVVTRHHEVDQVLRDHDVYRSDPRSSTQDLVDPFGLLDPARPSLFMLDPPGHTRLRKVIHDAFSPHSVQRLVPLLAERIQQVIRGLGRPGDQVDLVPRFAAVVPWLALDLITGLETRDIDTVTRWVSAVVHALEPIATARTARESLTAYRALGSYLDERRSGRFPKGTLCATLQQAVQSGRVSDPEARQLLVFVVLAGTKTSLDMLANAARQVAALAPATRRRIDAALIEDLLVRTSPVQLVARTATAATVLGGRTIRAGQRVVLGLASANRDLEAEAGQARGVGPGRRDVTFGRGIHRCPGAHLARLQAHLALSMLLDAFPDLTLLGSRPSRRGVTLRGWESVVVRL